MGLTPTLLHTPFVVGVSSTGQLWKALIDCLSSLVLASYSSTPIQDTLAPKPWHNTSHKVIIMRDEVPDVAIFWCLGSMALYKSLCALVP